jgi:uncharacterized membrane protein YphA (DoxX/SURF4 family)
MNGDLLRAAASGLAFWPGLLLVAAGAAKASDVWRRRRIGSTVVGRLLEDRVPLRPAWAVAAAVELAAGALVLSGLLVPWPEAAAALVLAAAAGIAFWGLRTVPGADCGCFGLQNRVQPWTIVRASLLAALAAAGALGGRSWWAVFDRPAALVPLLAAGALVAWLSPELPDVIDALEVVAGKPSARLRRIRSAACERRAGPVEESADRLRRTELWKRAQPYLSGDAPTEDWFEGCTRLLCYPAVYEGESATAVFAVGLGRRRSATTVAFVNEEERRVLARLDARDSS